MVRLRALLIQKDVKLHVYCKKTLPGLRALLIQKDVKQYRHFQPVVRV